MKTFKTLIGSILCAVVTLSVIGCVRPIVPEEEKKDPVVVDDSFDYFTIRTVDVSVIVNDQYNGQYYYVVEILDGNPFTGSDVNVLDAGVAKGTTPYTAKVALAKITNAIYIRQTDPSKRTSTKVIEIDDKLAYSCDFRTNVTGGSSSQVKSSSVETKAPTREYASSYTLPATYTTLSASDGSLGAGTYYIPAGVTLNPVSFWGAKNLYIAGTLNLSLNNCFGSGSKIVILNGGKLILPSNNVIGQGTAIIAVHQGGEIVANGKFELNAEAKLINDGVVSCAGELALPTNGSTIINNATLTANYLRMSNKSEFHNYSTANLGGMHISTNNPYVYNAGTVTVTGTFTSTNQGATVENHGTLKADKIDALHSGINIQNYCKIKTRELIVEGGTIDCYAGSLLACELLELLTSKNITLRSDAMFAVTDLTDFATTEIGMTLNSNRSEFTGVPAGGKTPVLIVDVIANGTDNNRLSLLGTMQVVFGSTFGSGFIHKIDSGITMTDTPIISSPLSSCNDLSFGDPGDPDDPDFPIAVVDSRIFTFAMEDNWPEFGDYDMNDVVYNIQNITRWQNESNQVVAWGFDVHPLAAGGIMSVCVMLQLDQIPSGSISNLTSSVYQGSIEAGQSKENIVLIPNLHRDAFSRSTIITNTQVGAEYINAPVSTYKATFVSPIAKEKLNVDNLNFYIYLGANNNDRREVHIGGFVPSDKVQRATNNYIGSNGMVWGFLIPYANFLYPIEQTEINVAYTKFDNWVKTYGAADDDWYKYPTAGKVYGM